VRHVGLGHGHGVAPVAGHGHRDEQVALADVPEDVERPDGGAVDEVHAGEPRAEVGREQGRVRQGLAVSEEIAPPGRDYAGRGLLDRVVLGGPRQGLVERGALLLEHPVLEHLGRAALDVALEPLGGGGIDRHGVSLSNV
jgi:hypothetical protein